MDSELVSSFKLWLASKRYSESTFRNYLADINRYIDFAIVRNPKKTPNEIHIFSEELLTNYLSSLSTDSNSPRYLASLNLFCQFALDQQLVTHNPLTSIRHKLDKPTNSTTLEDLLPQYQAFLSKHHNTPATIRNYLNDVQQYINWLESSSHES